MKYKHKKIDGFTIQTKQDDLTGWAYDCEAVGDWRHLCDSISYCELENKSYFALDQTDLSKNWKRS